MLLQVMKNKTFFKHLNWKIPERSFATEHDVNCYIVVGSIGCFHSLYRIFCQGYPICCSLEGCVVLFFVDRFQNHGNLRKQRFCYKISEFFLLTLSLDNIVVVWGSSKKLKSRCLSTLVVAGTHSATRCWHKTRE